MKEKKIDILEVNARALIAFFLGVISLVVVYIAFFK